MIGLLVIAAGIGIIFFQIIYWLLYAEWIAIPTSLAIAYIWPKFYWSWVYNPQSLIGLAKIIRYILACPFSLFFIISGIFLMISFPGPDEDSEQGTTLH